MGTPKDGKDWERELLERAREIYQRGEGKLVFEVRESFGVKRKRFRDCIISGGETVRFREEKIEKPLDKS